MAQGTIKKGAKVQSSSHKAKKFASTSGSNGAPKRNVRVTKAPKRASAQKKQANNAKLMKQFQSGLIARTEKLLGDRAGHLELIGPGKKRGPGRDDKKPDAKGGSRKFG